MYTNPDIESSYKENNIGLNIYQAVMSIKPNITIEFGCLYGYSTIAIASALRDINQGGKLICFDLWEDYKYKHSTFNQTKENVAKYGLSDYVSFCKMDFNEWLKKPTPFDLMHLDISNTGDTILKAYNALPKGSKVIFEGGSEERDKIEWMVKYNATPINSIRDKVRYGVLNPLFPSISMFIK